MPVLPSTQWFSPRSNFTLEEIQQKLQEGKFYLSLNTQLAVSKDGAFMAGFVYPLVPSPSTP